MKIILASKSPRRKELLSMLDVDFDIIEAVNDEIPLPNLTHSEQAEHLSFEKANEVFNKTTGDRVVIGSDTTVVINDKVYGKPKDESDAFETLKILSGNTHQVYTGLTIISEINGVKSCSICSDVVSVKFVEMSDKDISEYIASKDPMDKAGSYGIQGKGAKFIESINGNYFSVMGLPIHLVFKIFKELGIK